MTKVRPTLQNKDQTAVFSVTGGLTLSKTVEGETDKEHAQCFLTVAELCIANMFLRVRLCFTAKSCKVSERGYLA